MPLYPFSSSFHPHPHPFVSLHICTDRYCSPVSSFASPSFRCAFLFHVSLRLSIIFLFTSLSSPLFSPSLSLPLVFSLSPLSLFPAFICCVSAPQTGCYVTVRWCVGLLKGLKGPPSWRGLLLPALKAALCIWSYTYCKWQYVTFSSTRCRFAS